jgi:hypothetical protein
MLDSNENLLTADTKGGSYLDRGHCLQLELPPDCALPFGSTHSQHTIRPQVVMTLAMSAVDFRVGVQKKALGVARNAKFELRQLSPNCVITPCTVILLLTAIFPHSICSGDFCRADIDGSKANVVMNARLPQGTSSLWSRF